MRAYLKKLINTYANNPYIRTIVKLIPKGDALDFLLAEKALAMKPKSPWLTHDHIENFATITNILNHSHEIGNTLKVKRGPDLQTPKLINLGPYDLNEKQKSVSGAIKHSLKKKKRPNDPCAVLLKEPDWKDDPFYLNYRTLYYSDLRALRKDNISPKIISANAVLYSEEERCLFLHRRSQESDDFPYTLHTFGGAFMPPDIGDRGDIFGLKECVVREVHEETGLSIIIPENTPVAIIDEYAIHFLQVSYLGINISKEQLKYLRPNWEGTITRVPFDDLQELLENFETWTITGWVDVLLWLSLGIPNSNKPISFSGNSAVTLSKLLLKQLTV